MMAETTKLSESCPKSCSRRVTPGKPGELRSCQTIAEHLPNIVEKLEPAQDSTPIRPLVAEAGPKLAKVGQIWPTFGLRLAHIGGNLAMIDPNWPAIAVLGPAVQVHQRASGERATEDRNKPKQISRRALTCNALQL